MPWGARTQAAIEAAGGVSKNAEMSLVNPAQILTDGDQVRIPSKEISSNSATPDQTIKSGQRINLNSATQAQIESLPGVGPKMAERILKARPFSSLKDLDAVKGIGPSMLKKLEPLVRF